jgi:hypothetical protein
MNMNDLQSAWNSPHNHPSAEAREQLARDFTRRMLAKRRFRAIWLANTMVLLALITGVALYSIAKGKTSLASEWGLLPLLILPWALAIHLLRRHLKAAAPLARGELSVTESFRVAHRSVCTEQFHLKLAGLLLVVMVPLLGGAMAQLFKVGKMNDNQLESMAVFFSAALSLGLGVILCRYFLSLAPQKRRLAALLGEFSE